MPRLIPTALPVLLVLLLAAVAGTVVHRWEPVAADSRDGAELRIVTAGELRSLDPRRPRELASLESRLIGVLWEPLLRLDPARLVASPGVAVAWEPQPDGRTLRLRLDPAARWGNGDPVTAGDFLRTLDRWGELARGHPFSVLLSGTTSAAALRAAARAPDSLTLEFTAAAPRSDVAERLAIARWLPTHASAPEGPVREGPAAGGPLTNGPYSHAGAERGDLVLRRNPHAVAPPGAPERIRVSTTPTPALYGTLLQSGRAHLSDQVGLSRDLIRASGADVVVEEEHTASVSLLHFNASRPPLDDPAVRRALSLALDRGQLARGFADAGAVPAYSFTPPGPTGVQPIRTVEEDLEQARRLLADAGYPGGAGLPVLRFPVVVGEGPANPLALLCAEQWRARLGVRVYVVPVSRADLIARAGRGDFDLLHMRWSAQAYDVSLLPSQLQEQLPAPFRASTTARFAGALARADALTGEARRTAVLAVEQMFVGDVPATPAVVYRRTTLRHRRLLGWSRDVFGLHPLRQLSVAPRPEGGRR
jgi:oligopeptide transport system substrate-binding protein